MAGGVGGIDGKEVMTMNGEDDSDLPRGLRNTKENRDKLRRYMT